MASADAALSPAILYKPMRNDYAQLRAISDLPFRAILYELVMAASMDRRYHQTNEVAMGHSKATITAILTARLSFADGRRLPGDLNFNDFGRGLHTKTS
ncbi:hypothetical protein [Bradyrhizobium sp. 153]|uniref:hypothetical protein n=1 Tax=Bradyrhizobium sp. 153 TaxID=2782627 RepID=UPI001FF8E7B7|nr:hypothetical protein [Bradyrhizobium sp. 153]MCK1663521.1 hypothetical protein [Bradyrhizobium sp. 153]